MTLANLLAIKRLLTFNATPRGVQQLLAAAMRNLADAQLNQLSAENRFDAAYKCIMQCAMLGLAARGYRTSTSQPGHHQTALQALPLTMGLPLDIIIVLDTLRRAAQPERLRRQRHCRWRSNRMPCTGQSPAGPYAKISANPIP